jgi:hypothetical protein
MSTSVLGKELANSFPNKRYSYVKKIYFSSPRSLGGGKITLVFELLFPQQGSFPQGAPPLVLGINLYTCSPVIRKA